jgi:MFS family permease
MQLGLNLPRQVRIYAMFFVYAFALGGIFPRLGDIQLGLGIGEGALGAALIGPGAGTLVALTFAGPMIERFGYRAILMVFIPMIGLLEAVASLAGGPLGLFVFLFGSGLLIGTTEIIINVEADRTEFALGRRLMNRAHAFWSFGFFAAGLTGALAKQFGVSVGVHLFVLVPVIGLATVAVLGRFEAATHRPLADAAAKPRFATPTAGILVLVVFTLSAMLLEGAGADWSAIFMRDQWRAAPFLAGFAVAAGALMQGSVRFFADGFVQRFGPLAVARAMIATLGVGTLAVVFGPGPGFALLGFGLIGAGTSGIFPLAMSAAAQRTDRPAAINVASLAQLSFSAFLIGPPLLGWVAEAFGIVMVYAVCLPLIILSWWAAKSLTPAPAPGAGKPVEARHG